MAETPDLTLAEIRDRLGKHGTAASISAIWRFFDRHASILKKPPTPPNRCAGRGRRASAVARKPRRA
jgi:hypothetical protein